MKKAASLVGVGAMVFALGLGTGYAEQKATQSVGKDATALEQAVSERNAKSKAESAKTEMEKKDEKGAPAVAPGVKTEGFRAQASTGADAKPGMAAPVKAEDVKKTESDAKQEVMTSPKATVEKGQADKTVTKADAEEKADKGADVKASLETKQEKDASAETSKDKPSDKTPERKPAEKQ